MDATQQQINLGATVCARLKTIYWADDKWSIPLSKQIAVKFGQLKRIARNFYSGESELEILKALAKYTEENIKEIFESEEVKDDRKVQSASTNRVSTANGVGTLV